MAGTLRFTIADDGKISAECDQYGCVSWKE
jgi:hypothetical protein